MGAALGRSSVTLRWWFNTQKVSFESEGALAKYPKILVVLDGPAAVMPVPEGLDLAGRSCARASFTSSAEPRPAATIGDCGDRQSARARRLPSLGRRDEHVKREVRPARGVRE